MMAMEAVKERTMGSNRVTVTLTEETFAKLGAIKNKSFRGRFMALAIERAFRNIDPEYYYFLTCKDKGGDCGAEAVAMPLTAQEQPRPQELKETHSAETVLKKKNDNGGRADAKAGAVAGVDAMEEFK
jgi:hypothetical protein